MKKFTAIILAFAMIFSLSACGGEVEAPSPNAPEPAQSAETPSEEIPAAAPAEISSEAPVKEPEISAEDRAEEIMKIYKDVLCGSVPFVIGKDIHGFNEGESYLLEDFAELCTDDVKTEWSGDYDCLISYGYLDCGSDGIPELSVELKFTNEEYYDSLARYYVVNCNDGVPTVIGDYDFYYRSYSFLNEAGLVENGGSSGAASHYVDYSLINADGEEQFLYSCSTEMANPKPAIPSYFLSSEISDDYYDMYSGEDVDTYYIVDAYSFEDFIMPGDEDEYDAAYDEYCRSFFFTITDESGENIPPAEEYVSLYNDYGVKIVSGEEAADMIMEHLAEFDVSDEIRQAPYVEYKNLDVDQLNDEVIENEDGSVTVGCTANLIENIKDGATIYLKPGVYNINEWTRANEQDYYSSSAYCRSYGSANPWNNHIFTLYGQLILNRINDLTIASLDPDDPAQIITDDENNLVMSFCECSDLSLVNIIAGHSPENKGGCTANVFEFNACDRVSLIDCDLYGCGCYGFNSFNTRDLTITGGRIHDCSSGMFTMNDTQQAVFTDVTFENCNTDWSCMFHLTGSNADFYSCDFRNLSDMFYIDSSFVWMSDCTLDEAAEASVRSSEYFGSSLNLY